MIALKGAKWKYYARILPALKLSLKHEGKMKTILKCFKSKIDTVNYQEILTKGSYIDIYQEGEKNDPRRFEVQE